MICSTIKCPDRCLSPTWLLFVQFQYQGFPKQRHHTLIWIWLRKGNVLKTLAWNTNQHWSPRSHLECSDRVFGILCPPFPLPEVRHPGDKSMIELEYNTQQLTQATSRPMSTGSCSLDPVEVVWLPIAVLKPDFFQSLHWVQCDGLWQIAFQVLSLFCKLHVLLFSIYLHQPLQSGLLRSFKSPFYMNQWRRLCCLIHLRLVQSYPACVLSGLTC